MRRTLLKGCFIILFSILLLPLFSESQLYINSITKGIFSISNKENEEIFKPPLVTTETIYLKEGDYITTESGTFIDLCLKPSDSQIKITDNTIFQIKELTDEKLSLTIFWGQVRIKSGSSGVQSVELENYDITTSSNQGDYSGTYYISPDTNKKMVYEVSCLSGSVKVVHKSDIDFQGINVNANEKIDVSKYENNSQDQILPIDDDTVVFWNNNDFEEIKDPGAVTYLDSSVQKETPEPEPVKAVILQPEEPKEYAETSKVKEPGNSGFAIDVGVEATFLKLTDSQKEEMADEAGEDLADMADLLFILATLRTGVTGALLFEFNNYIGLGIEAGALAMQYELGGVSYQTVNVPAIGVFRLSAKFIYIQPFAGAEFTFSMEGDEDMTTGMSYIAGGKAGFIFGSLLLYADYGFSGSEISDILEGNAFHRIGLGGTYKLF